MLDLSTLMIPAKSLVTDDRYFNFCVPLRMLLGFCEDYKRVVINARHKLILIRAPNDNCIVRDPATELTLELFKIQWQMPRVILNKVNKLCTLESERYLSMSFRSWELYEYPLLPSTMKHSWVIKTTTQLEKPQYIIFGLQTDKKNIMIAHKTYFDTCKLTNVKFYLNSEFYPYADLNLDFDKRKATILYDMYLHFRMSYYQIPSERNEPSFQLNSFFERFYSSNH